MLAVRTPVFQTWIVQRATSYLASELETRVEINRIEIEFFRTLSIKGLYIEDKHRDTLIYAGEINTVIDMFAPGENKIFLSDIELINATVKIQKYKNEKGLNFNFIEEYFSSDNPDTTIKPHFHFDPGEVRLNNVEFVYRDNRYDDYFKGVDFEDIRVHNIQAVIDDIQIENDTVSGNIQNITFTERSGFRLEYLETTAKFTSQSMEFDNMLLKTPYTQLQGWLSFKFESFDDFDDFITKVKMNSEFDESKLSSKDLVFFASELEGLEKEIIFSGKIKGTVDQLRGRNLEIAFGDYSRFKGDISIAGLPDFTESFFDIVVEELVTDKNEIESIPEYPFTDKINIQLPPNLSTLGKVKFSGKFTGFLNDFVAYGNANTDIGYISSDINLKIDEEIDHSSYSGHLSVIGFDVGTFTANSGLLGLTTFKAKVTGNGFSIKKVNAKMDGVIELLTLNGYNYKNIVVNANIAKKLFNGFLTVRENNLGLDFNGTIDFSNAIPVFDFKTKIENARLTKLNLLDRDTTVAFNSTAEINIKGRDIDEMTGYIRLGKTTYTEVNDTILLDTLVYVARSDGMNKSAVLESDILDLTLNGSYKRSSMFKEFENLFTSYIPILNTAQNNKKQPEYLKASYDMTFKNTSAFTKVFFPKFNISYGTRLSGKANSTEDSFTINLVSDSLRYSKALFSGINLSANTGGGFLNLENNMDLIEINDTLRLAQVKLEGKTNKNQSGLKIALAATDTLKTNLVIRAESEYLPSGQIRAKFLPSVLVMDFKEWTIDPDNAIFIDSNFVVVNNLNIISDDSKISIGGKASANPDDRLNLDLVNFDASVLNPFLALYDISMGGKATGESFFAGILAQPGISSDMTIKNLSFSGDTLGDATIDFNFLTKDNLIIIDALVDRGGVKNIEVKGKYFINPVTDSLDFNIRLQKTSLAAFSDYAKDIVSDIRGNATGELNLSGALEKLNLTGKVRLQQASFVIDYLNTRYSLAEEVEFNEKYFRFRKFKVNDENGHQAEVDGYVYHNHLRNFILDLNIDAKNFQMLNTTMSQNELYYGRAYGTGKIKIVGPLDLIYMRIAIKTERETRIFIPLSNPEEVSRISYINFVNHNQEVAEAIEKDLDLSGIEMDFELDVTPDAEIQLIFDSKIGDIIKGRGTGNINMSINTNGDFRMYGNYQVVSGDYLFTLQNLLNKKFIVQPGGTIRWNGSPYEAEIDLEGIYKLKASLYDLIQDTTYTERIPVEVHLRLTDELFNPTIKFNIEVPDIDPTAATLIDRYISTEQDKSKQTMSLLVLNRFSPADDVNYQGSSSTGVSANAAELLSQQLSNWASQISDVVAVGVKYRAADAFSQEELEVALSTRLFNDRVSLDGNVGVSGNNNNNQNTSNLVGDFNVEVKVNKDGKLRFKAFNKTINSSILNNYNSPYTQGIGVFYREEFDTVKELLQRYLNKLSKKSQPSDASL